MKNHNHSFIVLSPLFLAPQAPISMKAMCQAAWLLTVAFGNLVVIIVAEGSLFKDRVRCLDTVSAIAFKFSSQCAHF